VTNVHYVVSILFAQYYIYFTYSKLRFLVKCFGLSYVLYVIISPVLLIYAYIIIRSTYIYVFGLRSVYEYLVCLYVCLWCPLSYVQLCLFSFLRCNPFNLRYFV
jgi:hypothetical protein